MFACSEDLYRHPLQLYWRGATSGIEAFRCNSAVLYMACILSYVQMFPCLDVDLFVYLVVGLIVCPVDGT